MNPFSPFPNWKARLNLILLTACISCTTAATGPLPQDRRSGSYYQNREAIQKGRTLVKDGDLIVRTGKDFISYTLRQFSQTDKTYSHCGLVRIENGKAWVYHAIGGEDNPKATLRKSSLTTFCDPQYNSGFGIFRYDLDSLQKKKLDHVTRQYYREKIPFDMKFDLQSDSSFYCAEFVYKVLNRITGEVYLPTSYLGDFRYVAIDNLYLNPHTCSVFQVKYGLRQ